eukprot:gene16964-18673_t
MTEEHRKLLQKHRMDLLRDMSGDRVASALFSMEIFNENDMQEVKAEKTPREKNEKLMEILPRRGSKAFNAFCEALREVSLSHLEVLLRNEDKSAALHKQEADVEEKSAVDGRFVDTGIGGSLKGPAGKSAATESEEVAHNQEQQDSGKDQGDGKWFSKSVKKEEPEQRTQRLPSLMDVDYDLNSDSYYAMDKYPRGLFLLINNKEFLPASQMENYPRNGTDVDANAMQALFTELGFNVHRYDNVSCYQIRKLVKQAATMDYSNLNCFVCAILTHGSEGVLYGTDGTVEIRDLTAYCRGQNLAGKPKLFIFQACQGSDYMDGVDVTDGGDVTDGPIDDRTNDISLPAESDFIYAYSTVPGYYSWRNSQRGSWFIQGIIEVFRANAHKMDVLRMLTRVNAIVATKKSQTGQRVSNNKRQIASIVTQTRKEFFLFPPQGPLKSE